MGKRKITVNILNEITVLGKAHYKRQNVVPVNLATILNSLY